MLTWKYLVVLYNMLCVLHVTTSVNITPSQSLPTELFKPIKPNSGSTATTNTKEVEVDNARFSEPPANPVNEQQQVFTRPKNRVNQGVISPIITQDQRFDRPEFQQNPFLNRQTEFRPDFVRPNNYVEQQVPNFSDGNQNGFIQRTYTVPGNAGQPPYTVTAYQSPTYRQSWSWSSDGGRTENFSIDPPSRLPNGFSINDLNFDDKLIGGFNNVPFGETQSFRSGYHTVRTTGPDGITREKTTTW